MRPTYQAIIDDATAVLYDSSDSPRIDAEVLLQHAIDKPLAWLIAFGDSVAEQSHIVEFYRLIELRQQGRPIAYLTGYKEFWSLKLRVNESVLIPRPDTETLVEQALERLPFETATRVVDLGTGSGAVALSIAKERPNASVLAVDTDEAALNIAKQNAQDHQLDNVQFLKSNWFEQIAPQKFDLIVSNPPYIAPNDEHLECGDLRFEPSHALISSQAGLHDIDTIIRQASNYLMPDSSIIIEHGYNQKEPVHEMFTRYNFDGITLYRDLNNLPRCTAARACN